MSRLEATTLDGKDKVEDIIMALGHPVGLREKGVCEPRTRRDKAIERTIL